MRYKFVIVSKDTNTLLTEKDFDSVKNTTDVEFILNNSIPITKIYNQKLAEMRKLKTHDYLIFVHSDAHVNIEQMLIHLEQVHGKYDILGLCGTEYVNISESPLNWYTASLKKPDKRWGSVIHGEIGNKQTYFSFDRPDITDHEVGCIDGVCIIFSSTALESNICFDEQFLFDQYDTDLSLQCILQYKLKLGVIVELSLIHNSVGKSILSIDFLIHELDLRRKWNFDIPPNSNLARLVMQLQQKIEQKSC